MPATRVPPPVSKPQLSAALRAAARDNLQPLTLILGCVFLLSAGFVGVWLRAGLTVPVIIELISSAANLAIFLTLWRTGINDRWTYPLLFAVAMIGGCNALSQLYLTRSPADTVNLALVVIATGLVSLSVPWTALIFALAWCGWFVMARRSPVEGGYWIHYGYVLAWTTTIACIIQAGRYRLIRRLIQAEARHQILVEHLPLVSYVADATENGKPIYVSPQIEQLLGYSRNAWVSSNHFWHDCLYPADRQRVVAEIRACVSAKKPWDVEYRMVARNGRVLWLHDRSTRLQNGPDGRPLAYGILVDITARKRVETLTTGGNHVLAALAAGASSGEVLDLLVRAAEEIQPGMVASIMLVENQQLRVAAAPNLPEAYRAAIERLPVSPAVATCGRAVTSGEYALTDDIAADPSWATLAEVALQAGLRACWSEPVVSAGGVVVGTLDMYYTHPNIPRPIDQALIRTAAGLAALAVERARTEADLTRHRERLEELVTERTRQLEESLNQLRHSERLASVGTLAAGIAHEINNPIGMILLSAEQLRTATVTDEDSRGRLLQDIVANARRCGRIVKSVLRFARHDPAERWPHDVSAVVQQAVDLTRPYALRLGGSVDTYLADNLPPVMLNPVEMEQVLVNLIRNGIESATAAPRVAITTSLAGNFVRIEVVDNGRGIPLEDRSRIFDPFFTTRQSIGGTGLGLSVTYGIVTDHGGIIQVQSPSAGGSMMIVDLPVHVDAQDGSTPELNGTATIAPGASIKQ